MAENFNLIFGSQAPTTATWTDADYQTGWSTVGSTPPTAEQFDFLQNRADLKAKELNDALTPLVQKSEADGRQAGTIYASGACVTVDGLPNGWLLECVVPGTSGTVAITIPDPLIDGLTIIDGTVTWALRKVATNGGLGYRQPNTTYPAGRMAYHVSLPTGWYLECTTEGTTAVGELVISSPVIGGTVTDGTVVWMINASFSATGGTIYKQTINRNKDDVALRLTGGTNSRSAQLLLNGGENPTDTGFFRLIAFNALNELQAILKGDPNGSLEWAGNDLAGSAIVAKSLGTNGYIKYASGLIIQWGISLVPNGTTTISYPINFTAQPIVVITPSGNSGIGKFGTYQAISTSFKAILSDFGGDGKAYVEWIAIGY